MMSAAASSQNSSQAAQLAPAPPNDTSWRRNNLGYLLFAAAGLCIRRKLDVVHASGFDLITDAQLALFQNLDVDGTRLTTLAQRAGQSKQSMIELVDKAERVALVERLVDVSDRRAKSIRPTATGIRLLGALRQGLVQAERRFEDAVGADWLRDRKPELLAYAHEREAADVASEDRWRTENIERVLSNAARRFVRDVLAAVHRRGYHDVTEVLLALFRNLDLDGARLTDVAAIARMTKQSMQPLVERADALTYVERRSHAHDKRAKTIHFTSAGLAMLDEFGRGVQAAEVLFAQSTGTGQLDELKARLARFVSLA